MQMIGFAVRLGTIAPWSPERKKKRKKMCTVQEDFLEDKFPEYILVSGVVLGEGVYQWTIIV